MSSNKEIEFKTFTSKIISAINKFNEKFKVGSPEKIIIDEALAEHYRGYFDIDDIGFFNDSDYLGKISGVDIYKADIENPNKVISKKNNLISIIDL